MATSRIEEYIEKIDDIRRISKTPNLSLENLIFFQDWARYWDQPPAPLGLQQIDPPRGFPPLHFGDRWRNLIKTRKVMDRREEERKKREEELAVLEKELSHEVQYGVREASIRKMMDEKGDDVDDYIARRGAISLARHYAYSGVSPNPLQVEENYLNGQARRRFEIALKSHVLGKKSPYMFYVREQPVNLSTLTPTQMREEAVKRVVKKAKRDLVTGVGGSVDEYIVKNGVDYVFLEPIFVEDDGGVMARLNYEYWKEGKERVEEILTKMKEEMD